MRPKRARVAILALAAAAAIGFESLGARLAMAAPSMSDVASRVERAVAGSLSEEQERELLGALAELSVVVADRYDKWVRTGAGGDRSAALSVATALLPLLERLHAHHQGRIDRAQAKIIAEDGNPETLYTERWWQLDRGFALAAAGQLAWLHYRLAMLNPGQSEKRKAWLQKSVKEFTQFIGAADAKMRLESQLGRALAERELGERTYAENDLRAVLEQAKGGPLYWPARLALGELRASAGSSQALAETAKLMAEARGGAPSDTMAQIRLLRLDALLAALAQSGMREDLRKEAASLAAQISATGAAQSQRVSTMVLARLSDPRPILGATLSTEWIAAENLAAAEKFEQAAKAYEAIARKEDAGGHADEVHHRLGVCYFRLGRYADAERELRRYLGAAAGGLLAAEAAYLQFRAAEGIYRAAPSAETRGSFLAVADSFVKGYPDHEALYEGAFRLGELLQGEGRYREAADAYAKVSGPAAFELRAAAAEVQCLADLLSTADDVDAAAAAELRARAEAAHARFEEASGEAKVAALEDLTARTTVARAMVAGNGPGADPETALATLDGFEERFPAVRDLALPVAALRLASAAALGLAEQAESAARTLADMPGAEANYFEIVERISRALLRRAADVAPEDPDASSRWAALAALLFDRMRAAGRPIPEEVKVNLAKSYVEQGRLADAAALYDEMIAARPRSRSLLRAAALVADKRRDHAAAADLWLRLSKLQEVATPAWYEARLASARAALAAGNADGACAGAREVDGFRPDLRDADTKKRFAELVSRACSAP